MLNASFLHFLCVLVSLLLCTLFHHRDRLLNCWRRLTVFLSRRFILFRFSISSRGTDSLLWLFLKRNFRSLLLLWLLRLSEKREFLDRLKLFPQCFCELEKLYMHLFTSFIFGEPILCFTERHNHLIGGLLHRCKGSCSDMTSTLSVVLRISV